MGAYWIYIGNMAWYNGYAGTYNNSDNSDNIDNNNDNNDDNEPFNASHMRIEASHEPDNKIFLCSKFQQSART